jgi:hypothetical protein
VGVTVIRYADPPTWRFIVCRLNGEVLTTLDGRASDRGIAFALNQPATTTGLVPSDDPEVNIPTSAAGRALLSHNTRLMFGLRRELRAGTSSLPYNCRFAGIVTQVEDVAADAPTSRYTASDPWQYLMSRPVRADDGSLPGQAGLTYTDASASDMALALLANTIAVDGPVFIDASDAGLIETTDVISGVTKFDNGLSVGEAWQQLCDTGEIDIWLEPVYEPRTWGTDGPILARLHIYKQKGAIRYDTVFGWDKASRSLVEASRLIDGTRLANEIQFYAGQGGNAVTTETDATSVALYGEYWAQQFMVGKDTQTAVVQAMAAAQLLIRKNGAKSIQLSPAPERSYLPLRDYQLGDYVPVWSTRALRETMGIDYASFDANAPGDCGYQRVYAIPIELDDNGIERPGPLLTASESSNSY